MGQKLEVRYGLFMAVSMVVGQMIGSGIFFKVDDVLASTNGKYFMQVWWALSSWESVWFFQRHLCLIMRFSPQKKAASCIMWISAMERERRLMWDGFISLCFYLLLAGVLLTVSGIYISHLFAEFIDFEPNFLHYSLIGWCNGVIFFIP